MSMIVPDGQIRFLSNVPLDKNYENSIDFLSAQEQLQYFMSVEPVKIMFGSTRIRDGVIAVNALADDILMSNYIMFQNTNFSNKWFYAFITDIEHVNNRMCHVYYQLDDIQTWMFDVNLTECFVEREHTQSDNMFEHLVDEGVNVSEYVNNRNSDFVKEYKSLYAILFKSARIEDDRVVSVDCMPWQGNLQGLGVIGELVRDSSGMWDANYIDDLSNKIKELVDNNAKDSIVGCVMYPADLLNRPTESGTAKEYAKTDEFIYYENFSSNTGIDGYTPKNKKLYNSPYCVIEIMASDGQKVTLQPEFIEQPQSSNPYIQVLPNASMNPSMLIVPHNYEGDAIKWDKAISFDAFPQIALSIDGYSAWVASGGLDKWTLNLYGNAIGNASTMVTSAVNKNVTGVVSGAVSGYRDIAESIINIGVAKHLPADVKGSQNSTPLTSTNKIAILIKQKCISGDTAKSIDDYFSMFGYKVNKIKQPSRRNRPHFTYLKTKGCHVNGGAPADAIERIEAIYDNGVRFWVNPSEVGNYTGVDNSPA